MEGYVHTLMEKNVIDGDVTSVIRPTERKRNRVTRKGKPFYVPLPRRILCVKRKGYFTAGPTGSRVWGITDQIHKRLCPISCCESDTLANKLGNRVDREIKKFARDLIGYEYLENIESKKIIRLLGEKNITLVTSSILVSNYKFSSRGLDRYSGTEIDVIGYDHLIGKYVVIEIKITSQKLVDLFKADKDSTRDVLYSFNRSYIGMCKAQLACATLMFRNTFIEDSYPLLVICERNGTCVSLTFDIDASSCHGLIYGY